MSRSRVRISTSERGPARRSVALTSSSTASGGSGSRPRSSSSVRIRSSMLARSSASVSNSEAARAKLVVERRQHLLVELLQRDAVAAASCRRRAPRRPRWLSPGARSRMPCSISSTSLVGAELDDVVALAGPVLEMMSTTATSPGAPAVPRRSTSDATVSWSASSPASTNSSPTSTSKPRHLELRPVGRLDGVLHRELGGELPSSRRRRSAARSCKSGCSDGPDAARARGAPEPARDVRLDRLGVEALLADPRDAAPPAGPCPARNPGILTRSARSWVACATACCDLAGRYLDGQPDAVAVEPLELGLHRRAIESEQVGLRARRAATVRAWTSRAAIRSRRTHKAYGPEPVDRDDAARAARARALGARTTT